MRRLAGLAPLSSLSPFALLNLAGAHPLHPQPGVPASELTVLTPALLAALFLITLVIVLTGCVCCRRNKFKQFSNAVTNDLPEMVGTSSQAGQISVPPIDTGIVNPIAEREFTIFGPLSPRNQARPRGEIEPDVEQGRIPRFQFFGPPDAENNNPLFENNNGPISPQELENIVNNNAENYIVSEYENRNLNNIPVNENVVVEEPSFSRPSAHREPRDIEEFAASNKLDDYQDWFGQRDNFSRNRLQYLQEISHGWFGRIVEAEAHDLINYDDESQSPKVTRVAVKILDENASIGRKCVFLDECKLYRNARHDNVLRFLGYNLRQDPWLMLFEYCTLGDLKTFLISNKSSMTLQRKREIPLKFQCEIASALAYLHSENVVHPDVACHSCMIADGLTAKLGDYGGAKNQHPSDFYDIFDQSIPIRWLAPEAWLNMQTMESNVWSLGIFLWESCNWGILPYDSLNNEQVVSTVLCQNGIRLSEPYSNNNYGAYLYQIMISCWNENPAERLTAVQALSLLQCIYTNHTARNSSDKDEFEMENFDSRWANLKPNTIPKVDNVNTSSQLASDKDSNYHSSEMDETLSKFDRDSLCPAESEGSTDVLDEFSEKTKSDSLTNLHGSLESIQEKSVLENDTCVQKNIERSHSESRSKTGSVAPWLQDLPMTSQEDMSYMKNVSEVISDLDNMLSSEKTSSSESSHQTSPSRDISNNVASPSLSVITNCIEDGDEDCLNIVKTDESAVEDPSNELSAVDSQNKLSQNVPEVNSDNQMEQGSYPILDFKLMELVNSHDEKDVHPIFQSNFSNLPPDYDSFQDNSYIPNDVKSLKSDEVSDKGDFCRQCSSGSETDDEIWKKRIEMGTISEKIKLKSKSVADFMILTHIDMDFTDLESEDASFTSVDGKFNSMSRKFKLDSPKDTSLPIDEFLSFPRNSSLSVCNREGFRLEIDPLTVKRNLRNLTLRNLRPVKSLNDLSSVNRNCTSKDLNEFKSRMDFLLELSLKGKTNEIESHTNDTWETTKYLDVGDLNVDIPDTLPSELVDKNEIAMKEYDSDLSASKIYDSPLVNTKTASTPVTEGLHNDADIKTPEISPVCVKADVKLNSEEPTVTLGPFSECTLDLYTGLKTTFKDDNPPSEEEALMFSTNFNEMSNYTEAKPDNFILNREKSDISSAYFFNSPAMKSMSGDQKPMNYSLETWDRFLNTSYENIPDQNFDSIFPDVSDRPDPNKSSNKPMPNDSNADNDEDDHNYFNGIPLPDEVIAQQYEENLQRYQDSLNDFTSKLAMAENENNLNIEQSVLRNNEGGNDVEDMIDHILNDQADVLGDGQFIGDKQDDTNSLPSPPSFSQSSDSEMKGWYLHSKNDPDSNSSERFLNIAENMKVPFSVSERVESPNDNSNSEHSIDLESVEALRTELELKLPLAQLMGQCPPQMTKEILPYIDKAEISLPNEKLNIEIDMESVEALRTELELKLPLVQQFIHDNMAKDYVESTSENMSSSDDTSVISLKENLENAKYDNAYEITRNPIHEIGKGKIEESQLRNNDISVRNEVMIHYNTYGQSLLSPIQEESWSDTSELEKCKHFERSDTSNSLSLGQIDSASLPPPPELPYDQNCDRLKNCSDDETNEDSHGSNQTFVALDGADVRLDKQISLSVDSLNGIDDQFDMQPIEVLPSPASLPNLPLPELITTLITEHPTTKSNEEISQNVDDLLENITKTLENASKVGSVSSDCIAPNPEIEEPSESESCSKTYVIDDKRNPPNDVTYVCPDKVFDVPDDISNVSKISQPSFVTDVSTSNLTESQLKPSDKSVSQNLHAKTPSIDSWCSNDTLFNVEENFDDICSLNDFSESFEKDDDEPRSITPTNEPITAVTCTRTIKTEDLVKQPSIEMVMQHPEGKNAVVDYIDPELPTTSLVSDCVTSPDNLKVLNELQVPKMCVNNVESDLIDVSKIEENKSNRSNLSNETLPNCSYSSTDKTTDMEKDSLNSTNSNVNFTNNAMSASTPNDAATKHSDMSVDSLESADVLIDRQFEFLNSVVQMTSLGEVDEPEVKETHLESSIVNYVSIENDTNFPDLTKVTHSFIEHEKNYVNGDFVNFKTCNDSDSKYETAVLFDKTSETDDNLTYSDFKSSAEKKLQCSTDLGVMENLALLEDSNDCYNRDNSALLEYIEHSGYNMDSLKGADGFRTPEQVNEKDQLNIIATGLGDIQFSGPVDETINSDENSCVRSITDLDDINNIPPECLKDYDSGSDESSSGEFMWKKGDTEESISLSASVYEPPQQSKKKMNFSGNHWDYEVITEESIESRSDTSDDSSDEEIEFTPSSWNYLATPTKSALKSPDTSQSENKKKVAFKKQKYPCVYEYPREVSDHEGDLIGASSYHDWQNYCTNVEFESQFDKYYLSPDGDDEFYISSSTAPFEPYNSINYSSQFFPGQLLDDDKSYDLKNELENEELPSAPSELDLKSEDINTIDNIVTALLTENKSSDFITPDSGTEDVTPGSLIDYDFKKDTNGDVKIESVENGSVNKHELKLNIVNRVKSLPNCGLLIMPDKSSPSESLTPSTPSPSTSIKSNHSSESTSPVQPSILGGLRHTRDKLKLDLPPSPLTRNSPSFPLSGKNSTEIKVFDFKTFELNDKPSEVIKDKIVCDSVDVAVKTDRNNSTDSEPLESLKEETVKSEANVRDQNWSPSNDSPHLEAITLQKAVIPINLDENHKKSILETVKGEGTLLDSGDEDSGIGSSAYTTLERKIESVKIDLEPAVELTDKDINGSI